jgi:putative N6-adenine-specific DNA methylase
LNGIVDADSYFATCGRGIEPCLARELENLGATAIDPGRGGVRFQGDRALLYRANLWLRSAIRVLRPILHATVTTPEELYDAVQSIDWTQFLTPDHTLAVDCNVRDSGITHSLYAALKTKDAICDQFISHRGRRPSVDTEEPMVGLNLHIARDEATLSLDSSGESLHKRGYRGKLYKAPLNEALAAAVVQLSGWTPGVPLVDPLCGSGTLPIEAAWLALRRPPGLTRRRFGFQGWIDFDIRIWTALRDEARTQVRKHLESPIAGADVRGDAIALAKECARAAGVGHVLRFDRRDVAEFSPPDGPPGFIVCNPPYGERLGDEGDIRALYDTLGRVFRERCMGWSLCVLTANPALLRALDLRPDQDVPLYNGKIPCRLLRFRL